MKFKRTASLCGECPLKGRTKVLGQSGVEDAKVVIIGDTPKEMDEKEGMPFAGMLGAKLKEAIAQSGLIYHMVHKTNLVSCRCTITSAEYAEAARCCRPGFLQEMEALKVAGAKVIVPVEKVVMTELGIEGAIGKMRGSVFPVGKGQFAVPTYSPSWILGGMWKEEPTWIADFLKAREISLASWKPPKEKFNLFPTESDVEKFMDNAIKKKLLVGVDIETTSLSPYHSKIIMIGFSISGEEVLVVPFTKKGGSAYWSMSEEIRVRKYIQGMFDVCPTMYQNGAFDVRHLEEKGYRVKDIAHDTMLLHHCINAELPHNLGYIVSVYGKTPAWKEVVKGQADRMVNMEDDVVRTYNARDAAVLHQVLPELLKDAKELNVEGVYRRFSMRLLRPLIEMSKEGMYIDPKRLAKLKVKFKKEEERLYKEMITLCKLPEDFNFDSPYQLQYLMFGTKPKAYEEWSKELAEYDVAGCKKKKSTKKYIELKEKVEIYKKITPLVLPKLRIRATAQGSATDDAAFLTLQRGIINRLEALKDRVRRTDELIEEVRGLEVSLKFVGLSREYSEAHKLATTYSGYPVGPDGRAHPDYRISGTATGRLSCQNPNLQTQGEAVQEIFTAGEGRSIIKADYSNIEYRVMARMTGEKWLEEEFDKGTNFHDINTKLLFSITKDNPQWDKYRRAAKTFIFGLSYGGTPDGIYEKILMAIPDFEMTLGQFRNLVREYFEKMPNYKAWTEKMRKQARETRCVETAFGFKRFLNGMPNEIERQALNMPIQGTAGEIAEEAICDCYEEFEKAKNKKWKARLVCTVHDSILVECQKEYEMDVAKTMKKIMEKEYMLCGKPMKFPVDVDIGPSWGECQKVKL